MNSEKVLTAKVWSRIIAGRGHGKLKVAEPWNALFAPLVAKRRRPFVIGQLGQSLDGRIATPSGHSHYINGRAALRHLHCLRALVDGVVVGIGTALADDPQLTVRQVVGPSPARVVIDPNGRLPATAKLLRPDGCRRIVVIASDGEAPPVAGVEVLRIARNPTGEIDPSAIVEGLSALGLERLLVEGGMTTVSGFLARGCLDRLHLAISPLIIGSGPVGLSLPPIDKLSEALRPPANVYRLGADLLVDCDLSRF